MAHVVKRKGKSGITYQVKWEHVEPGYGGSLSFRAKNRMDDPAQAAKLCAQWISARGNRVEPNDTGLIQEVFLDGIAAEPEAINQIVMFRDLAHDWCFKNRRRANPSTKKQYWARFVAMEELSPRGIMSMAVKDITLDDLSTLVTILEKHRAPNTVLSYMTCVRGVLRLAVARGTITVSPFNNEYHRVDEPSPKDEVSQYLRPEEVAAISAHCKEDAADIIEFQFWAGLRISETLCLKKKDCLFDARGGPKILVSRHQDRRGKVLPGTKGNKDGHVAAMLGGSEEILRRRCENKGPEDWVFPPPRNRKHWVYRDWLMFRFRPAMLAAVEAGEVAARPDGIGPHLLRHGCAVDMLNHGHSLLEVMVQFGHGDIKTTNKYYFHWSDEQNASLMRTSNTRGVSLTGGPARLELVG